MTPVRPEPPSDGAPGRVLVVDDTAANRELLRAILEPQGYLVFEADHGVAGLAAVTGCRPDVILLDVMMPGMDGFEVCRRLKAERGTVAIPVLMVTSLAERQQRLEGISAGASDFVTRPVDVADLLLRVRNAIQGKRLYDEMEAQYTRLRELEALRDDLVHMLVHDVRSPLGAMMAHLHLLAMDAQRDGMPGTLQAVAELQALTQRMSQMVSTVLDVSRLESGRMPVEARETDLRELAALAIAALGPDAARRVRVEADQARVPARLDRDLIGRVLVNLIGNALKFGGESPVEVTLTQDDSAVRVDIRDHGPGIAQAHHKLVFEKFGQVRSQLRQHGTGLGLAFCRMAVEAHGGEIGLTSEVGQGSTFWFLLPGVPAGDAAAGVAG